jgi:hypothetical protein
VGGIEIETLACELEGDIDHNGVSGLDADVPKGYTDLRMTDRVQTDPKNREQLQKLAEFSPVYTTITDGADVDIRVIALQEDA